MLVYLDSGVVYLDSGVSLSQIPVDDRITASPFRFGGLVSSASRTKLQEKTSCVVWDLQKWKRIQKCTKELSRFHISHFTWAWDSGTMQWKFPKSHGEGNGFANLTSREFMVAVACGWVVCKCGVVVWSFAHVGVKLCRQVHSFSPSLSLSHYVCVFEWLCVCVCWCVCVCSRVWWFWSLCVWPLYMYRRGCVCVRLCTSSSRLFLSPD